MIKSRGLLAAVVAVAVLLATGALAACGGADETASAASTGDVVATTQNYGDASQFAEALAAAGVDGDGPFTVFAASDDAVAAAGAAVSSDAVHAAVIEGERLTEADLGAGSKTDSMLADNTIVTYTGADGSIYVNDHKVVAGPLGASDGVVYVIDGLIQPKE
jgi:uncharacterized surface protein with fasciclin (FAS1) repeats